MGSHAVKSIFAPAGFWPRRPKPEEATIEVPAYRVSDFGVMQKKSRFLRKKFAKDCPKARKGLKKTTLGVERIHIKERRMLGTECSLRGFASAEGKVVAL